MADIKFIITADDKGAVTKIERLDKSVGGVGTTASKATPKFGGMFGKMAIGIATVATLAKAFSALKGFMSDAIEKAGIQEEAEIELASALRATGRTVSDNLPHFRDYAKELQSQTIFGDEAILSAQTLMVALTDLDQEGIDRATKGAIGLATVFKQDLKASTSLVAKALAGNYGALSRYGLTVTKTASAEEKRNEILEKLASFYEIAESKTVTFSGKVKQLSNIWGDAKEAIGDVIIKNEGLRDIIDEIGEKVSAFVESEEFKVWAEDLGEALEATIEVGWELVRFISEGLTEALGDWLGKWKTSIMIFETISGVTRGWIKSMKEDHDPTLKSAVKHWAEWTIEQEEAEKALKESKKKTEETTGAVGGLGKSIKVTTKLIESFVPQAHSMRRVMDWNARTIGETAVPAMNNLSGVVYNVQTKFKDAYVYGVDYWTKGLKKDKSAWDDIADGLQTKWSSAFGEMLRNITKWKDGFKSILNAVVEVFTDFVGQMTAKWMVNFIGKLVSSTADAGKKITETIGNAVSSATGGGGGAGSLLGAVGGASPGGLVASLAGGAVSGIMSMIAGGKTKGAIDATNRQLQLNWIELRNILNNIDNIKWILNDVKVTLWKIADNIIPQLDSLKKIGWEQLSVLKGIQKIFENIKFGQRGISETAYRPTMYIAGERRPEEVEISPRGRRESPVQVTQNFNFSISAVDAQSFDSFLKRGGGATMVHFIQRQFDMKNFRIPILAVGK